MNINELFPSKFVAAADLRGQDVQVMIAKVTQEKVGTEQDVCPILYFQGMQKGMVMNRTNAKRIAKMYGTETSTWIGKRVTLYPSVADFRGEEVPCIRIRDESALVVMGVMAQGPVTTPATTPVEQRIEPAAVVQVNTNGSGIAF